MSTPLPKRNPDVSNRIFWHDKETTNPTLRFRGTEKKKYNNLLVFLRNSVSDVLMCLSELQAISNRGQKKMSLTEEEV
jgi:hypothetical protein